MQKGLSQQIDEFINNPEALISPVSGPYCNANALPLPLGSSPGPGLGAVPPQGVTDPPMVTWSCYKTGECSVAVQTGALAQRCLWGLGVQISGPGGMRGGHRGATPSPHSSDSSAVGPRSCLPKQPGDSRRKSIIHPTKNVGVRQ